MLEITINGEARQFPAPLTVSGLTDLLELTGKRMAVERNGENRRQKPTRYPSLSGDTRKSSSPLAAADQEQFMEQLIIAGKAYNSRLLVGTGKYKDFAETRRAIDASGAEIVTVAIRRTNIGQEPGQPNLLDALPPAQFTILPNTAGCYSADDAVRTLRLARELLDGHPLCKLEVLGDPTSLFPNMPETLKAAAAGQGRFRRHGLLLRRPDSGQNARRHRLRRDHAAGFADRFRHGYSQLNLRA